MRIPTVSYVVNCYLKKEKKTILASFQTDPCKVLVSYILITLGRTVFGFTWRGSSDVWCRKSVPREFSRTLFIPTPVRDFKPTVFSFCTSRRSCVETFFSGLGFINKPLSLPPSQVSFVHEQRYKHDFELPTAGVCYVGNGECLTVLFEMINNLSINTLITNKTIN